jgi:2-oxoglutarate ferredoxin oxidoreductase subunit beta
VKKTLQMQGFRFIEVVSQCPTAFGRRAGFKDAGEMIRWFKTNTLPIEQTRGMSEDDLVGKIVVGEFAQRKRPTLVETVYAVIKEAQGSVEENRD